MSSKFLFSDWDFGVFADSRRFDMASRLEKLSEKHFKKQSLEEISEELVSEYSLVTPVLLLNQIFQKKPVSIKIGMDSDYNGKISKIINGTRYEIIIPFSGNQDLFFARPTIYTPVPPFGQVNDDGIHFIYEAHIFHDNSFIQEDFEINCREICVWLENLSKDVSKFNERLKADVGVSLKNIAVSFSDLRYATSLLNYPVK